MLAALEQTQPTDSKKKALHINRARMELAVAESSIDIPMGLSREEKRRFILSHAK